MKLLPQLHVLVGGAVMAAPSQWTPAYADGHDGNIARFLILMN